MEFKITTMPLFRFMSTGMMLFLIWILGGGLIGLFTRNVFYAFSYLIVIPIIILQLRSILFPAKQMTIQISEMGLELKEKDESINWDVILWYHFEIIGKNVNLQIKLINGKTRNIFFVDRGNNQEWQRFINTFLANAEEKCPNMIKRFDSKFWRIFVITLIVLDCIFPIMLVMLKVKPMQILATCFTLLGMSAIIILKIRNNGDVPKRNKTYSDIQNEKKTIS